MVFSSAVFLFLFLPVLLILYYNPLMKKRGYRNILLLLASIGFYAWGEPAFIFVMLFSVVMNWGFGLLIGRKGLFQKGFMVLGVCYNVGLIFVFKYLAFCLTSLRSLFGEGIQVVEIALPIGISFFTFQMLSYLLDVYFGKARPQKNLFTVALYIMMFPQLVAGPIVRYETVASELKDRQETWEQFCQGIMRFVIGLSKKMLLANYIGLLADDIFNGGANYGAAIAWLGAIAYTLQIYFDFSGYSDMAIGLGLMFGFHFEENFNYPYMASSITDFWRRWHMSLSTWFRDYVYIPLGGNRVGKGRLVFNLFVVWGLTGIWHGANWTFLAWGLFYFVLLTAEKFIPFVPKMKWFSHVYAMFLVILGWVLFRCESIGAAAAYVRGMFNFSNIAAYGRLLLYYLDNSKWVLLAAVIAAFPIVPSLSKRLPAEVREAGKGIGLTVLLLICLLVMMKDSYNPFIYFNF